MKYHLKRDANHVAVTKALKACGALVVDLSRNGAGVPDLLVGFRGKLHLLEIKNPKGRGKRLTPAQEVFHQQMKRYVSVVTCDAEAMEVLGFATIQSIHSQPQWRTT